MTIITRNGTIDATDKPDIQAPLLVQGDSTRPKIDLDLAPIMRTEGNYWRAQFFQASRELTKANKGIRRLKAKITRLEAQNNLTK